MECRISESFVRDSRMWQVFNSNWQFQQMASTFLRRVHYRDIPYSCITLFQYIRFFIVFNKNSFEIRVSRDNSLILLTVVIYV